MLTESFSHQAAAHHIFAYDLERTRRAHGLNQKEAAYAFGMQPWKYAKLIDRNENVADTGILMLFALYNDDGMPYSTFDLSVTPKNIVDSSPDERRSLFAAFYRDYFFMQDDSEYDQHTFGVLFHIPQGEVASFLKPLDDGGTVPPAWLLIFLEAMQTFNSLEAGLQAAATAVEKTFERNQCISYADLMCLQANIVRHVNERLRIRAEEYA